MNRRQFLKKASSAVVALNFPTIIPSSVLGRGGRTVPNDRIVMGMIGVGDMGTGHVRSFLGHQDVQIVAICDVRESHRVRAKGIVDQYYNNHDCVIYGDFRELLDRGDIDAVCLATPDHWHTLIGLEAARQGKHIYYEKPLSLSIEEAKSIRAAVKQYNIVFQFGTQQRSDNRFRFACELVRNGRIGQLQTIMLGSANYKPIPNQPTEPIPSGFDYDLWLGPAPAAPYTHERCTRNWTLIYDYSLGCVSGAWGIHDVDIAQWANESDHTYPITTEGTGVFPTEGLYDTAVAWEVEHTYPNGVILRHMDMPTALKRAWQFNLHWMGILFIGSEGWIFVCRELIETDPKSLLKINTNSFEIQLPRSTDHRCNFIDAVKSNNQPISSIDVATHSDIVCHLADISMRLGRKLCWDPENERFIGDDEANRLMSRPLRSPWHL